MTRLKKERLMNAGRPANTPEVLWSKVDKRGINECWPWIGFRNKQGYGRTWINDKGYYAHRVIYDLQFPGVIQRAGPATMRDGGFVRHRCDNPCCCNPWHLEIGTHADNMRDKVQRGRSRWFSDSTQTPNAKLSADEVREIRFIHRTGRATKRALCMLYGVSMSSIKFLLCGRSYGDIE